jgi:hypothetical protein
MGLVAAVWVVRFVVRFVRIAFLLRLVMACYLPRLALAPEGRRAANGHFGCAHNPTSRKISRKGGNIALPLYRVRAVPKLCQNPICLACLELLFEREQLPQVIDNKHFRIELIEFLEPVIVLRNQQVAGSIPAGGSRNLLKTRQFQNCPIPSNVHFRSNCAKTPSYCFACVRTRLVVGPPVQFCEGLAFHL